MQYLNFTEHSKKRKSSDSFHGTDGAGKKISCLDTAEAPAIANSKWTKYLDAYKEACDQDIDPSPDCGKASPNSHPSNEKNSLRLGFIKDQEETNSYSSDSSNINEISTAEVLSNENGSVSGLVKDNLQPSNVIVNSNFEDAPSVRDSHSPYDTASTTAPHNHVIDYGKAESTEEFARSLLLSSSCSSDSSEENGESTFVPKNIKRNFHDDNTTSQYESETPSETGETVREQTKLEDEFSLKKKNLRDIVARNRSKIGRSTEKIVTKGSLLENDEPVSKEIGCLHNFNPYPDVSKSGEKKKTIFESDCKDFDEIPDVL